MSTTYRAGVTDEGNSAGVQLVAGNAHLLVGRVVTLLAGAVYPEGALLGKLTVGGKYKVSASAANDGSEVPDLVLGEPVDATAGDRQAMAYSRGDFNANAITFGAGHTVASVREGLRVKGIQLLPSVPA
ncbi:head decoration protein [uncultured Xylophilus sp.]|uniref:head decoration protein n=1 Tax=uncultured Xylophilus sp. TaxID=296832 RepID=UPI0025DDE854|nr:head decoration protein [uncultured Xylophilus sp.]